MSDEAARRLEALRREREALLARVSWWENHRASALIPMAALSFAAGYGVGYLLHLSLGWPYQLGYLSAIAAMFLSGRLVERYTNPARLPLLEARIAKAERELSAASRGSSPARG